MAPESDDSCHVYIMSLLLVLNKEIYFLSNTIAFLSLVLENSISIIANLTKRYIFCQTQLLFYPWFLKILFPLLQIWDF
jgi:hypothetical protein